MAYTTINKPSEYFNTKLYTGNNSTQSITGVNFQPDFSWIKCRNAAFSHLLFDVNRGATNFIKSNSTDAEGSNVNFLTSFDSDGFSLGNDSAINGSGNTYASWNWLAGGTGVSNTDGDVTATVSANQTSGFSIVKYVNPASGSPFTVGHGLGSPPKMVITKNTSGTQTWGVWHTGIGFGNYIRLDSSAASSAANLVTATSSTTFSTYRDHHSAGVDLIAYCFAEKKGFSKFGSYTGNGNADGPFIYTGFKPAFVLIKNYSSAVAGWFIHDNKRENTFNPHEKVLFPSNGDAESTYSGGIDMLSNGFKIRYTAGINGSSLGYIYMAFAENPLVGTNNIPATAR